MNYLPLGSFPKRPTIGLIIKILGSAPALGYNYGWRSEPEPGSDWGNSSNIQGKSMSIGACRPWGIVVVALLVVAGISSAGIAGSALTSGELRGPVALTLGLDAAAVPVLRTAPVDISAEMTADLARKGQDLAPRFAVPEISQLTPDDGGSWLDVEEQWVLWRQRIVAPGAISVNLGFSRFHLPKGARLTIHPTGMTSLDDPRHFWTFTERNNEAHGQLWTPVVLADDITVELLLPRSELGDYALELESINKGYRLFGEDLADKAGSCNVDVVCPEGDPWRSEIATVGVYTLNGSWTCTGAMINNTAEDQTPFFLTANHCGINSGNAASMVVYWNFESPTCGQQGGGSLAENQAGATFLASSSTSDFCLVELNADPDPAWKVAYAGWYRGSDDPSAAIAIHQPNTDEKSISFEYDPTSTTTYLLTPVPGDGSHIRITDWDVGTTEPGSSGSPLFDPGHHIVGQLHGGYAACGNDTSDWYGRLSVSWDGNDASSRLRDWLDPLGSAPMALGTLDPNAAAFQVSPGTGLQATGDVGGPFAPASQVYVLNNVAAYAVDYQITSDVAWAVVSNGTGTLAAGGTDSVTVSIGGTAATLPTGTFTGTVSLVNLTDGSGDTTRPLQLKVGIPELIMSFPLDSDPLWSMDAGWAFGIPQGGGGSHGDPDPVSGYSGANVLGYNLAGDYENNLLERWLTTTSLDLTGVTSVTVKFRRWLGVEQPAYDHASFQVSSDGVNFTPIWSNSVTVSDGAWTSVEYDLSAVADGQQTVFLAWVMGMTDDSWQYCGWNIDDIEIWGLRNSVSAVETPPAPAATVGNYPNPFNPLTRVSYDLPAAGRISLGVYDIHGRLVRLLIEDMRPAGPGSVVWDGQDNRGQSVGSGVYFARLVSAQGVTQHKMVLVK